MLTKEPEMLQPDAFCEHTMQQTATAAAGGAYSSPPDLLAGFKGATSRRGEAKGRKGKGGEKKGGEGIGREGGKREGRLTLTRSWNRAAGWLRPALRSLQGHILE